MHFRTCGGGWRPRRAETTRGGPRPCLPRRFRNDPSRRPACEVKGDTGGCYARASPTHTDATKHYPTHANSPLHPGRRGTPPTPRPRDTPTQCLHAPPQAQLTHHASRRPTTGLANEAEALAFHECGARPTTTFQIRPCTVAEERYRTQRPRKSPVSQTRAVTPRSSEGFWARSTKHGATTPNELGPLLERRRPCGGNALRRREEGSARVGLAQWSTPRHHHSRDGQVSLAHEQPSTTTCRRTARARPRHTQHVSHAPPRESRELATSLMQPGGLGHAIA
jgi:hypothetical protein